MIAKDRDAHSLRSSKSAARKQVKELIWKRGIVPPPAARINPEVPRAGEWGA